MSPQVRARAVAEADAARVAAMQSREEELEAMLSQAQVRRWRACSCRAFGAFRDAFLGASCPGVAPLRTARRWLLPPACAVSCGVCVARDLAPVHETAPQASLAAMQKLYANAENQLFAIQSQGEEERTGRQAELELASAELDRAQVWDAGWPDLTTQAGDELACEQS